MVQVTPVQCRANDYVHTSGVAFVRISNWDEEEEPFTIGLPRPEMEQLSSSSWGFHWMHNYMLTKRWRSAATGDSEAASKVRSELEDFCADKNGDLKTFWESCKEAVRKAVQKGKEEENKAEAKKNGQKVSELKRDDAVSCDSQDVKDTESSTIPSKNDLPVTQAETQNL